jgi:hypothetical protein
MKILKAVWKTILNIVMGIIGFFLAWALWSRTSKDQVNEEYFKKKAVKAGEGKSEEILNTDAADIGSKYLSADSNAAIDGIKKSARERILDRISKRSQ